MMITNYLKTGLLFLYCILSFSSISGQVKYAIQSAENCNVIRENVILAPVQAKILFLSDSIIFGYNSKLQIKKLGEPYESPKYFEGRHGTYCLSGLLTDPAKNESKWKNISSFFERNTIHRKGVISIAGTRKNVNDSIMFVASVFQKIHSFVNDTIQSFTDFSIESGVNAKLNVTDSLLYIQNNLKQDIYVDILYKAGEYIISLLSTDSRFLTDLCIPSGSSLTVRVEIDMPKDNLLYIVCSEFPMPLNGIMNENFSIIDSLDPKYSIKLQMMKISYK